MLSARFIEGFLEHKIKKNMTVALGTSKTAYKVIRELALKDVLKNLNVKVMPTSLDIAELCHHYGLKLANGNEKIDLVIEFASSVDHLYNYTKSDTQSLIRDQLIAYYAKELIVFVEKANIHAKITEIPVEVATFGLEKTLNALDVFGKAKVRMNGKKPFKTLGQNQIVDLKLDKVYDYQDLDLRIKEIPGVLETGLFVNMADRIFIVDKKKLSKFAELKHK